MEINYIILAHKNPSQLHRLVQRLNGEDTYFYIHIDKRESISAFTDKLKDFNNVYFLGQDERKQGIWGDIGIVQATLCSIKKIISHNRKGYCILLTGQDYPLKNNTAIKSFLSVNEGVHFIDYFVMPGRWGNYGKKRITQYKINKSTDRGHMVLLPSLFDKDFYTLNTLGILNYLRKSGRYRQIFKIFRKRSFPSYLQPYGGSVYWALPVETLHSVINFTLNHPDYEHYHKYTLCVDEIFFHSIILALQKKSSFEIANSLTYVNWSRPTGPYPATFTSKDIEELKDAAQAKLFARKFDITQDSLILDLIDSNLLNFKSFTDA